MPPACTIPDVDPTVAIPVLLLLHKPPPVASLRLLVFPAHALAVPPIPEGDTFTVTMAVAVQPAADV